MQQGSKPFESWLLLLVSSRFVYASSWQSFKTRNNVRSEVWLIVLVSVFIEGRTSYLLNIRQCHPMYWLSWRQRHRKCIHATFAVIWSYRQEEPPTARHIRNNNDRSIINVPIPSMSANFKTFEKNWKPRLETWGCVTSCRPCLEFDSTSFPQDATFRRHCTDGDFWHSTGLFWIDFSLQRRSTPTALAWKLKAAYVIVTAVPKFARTLDRSCIPKITILFQKSIVNIMLQVYGN